MKKFTIASFLILIFATTITTAKKNLSFKLHVRATGTLSEFASFKKEDMALFINDQPINILSINKKIQSFGQIPKLSRNIILIIDAFEHSNQLVEFTTSLCLELLNNGDILILVSPTKIYNFNVTRNRLKLADQINELLKKDCQTHKVNCSALERILEKQISLVEGQLLQYTNNPVFPDIAINNFFKNFSPLVILFRKRFLFPNVTKLKKIVDLLGDRGGERYWTYINKQGSFPFISKLQKVYNRLEITTKALFKKKLFDLNNALLLSSPYPSEMMINLIKKANTNCSTIHFKNPTLLSFESTRFVISNIKDSLREITLQAGGTFTSTSDVKDGIQKFKEHPFMCLDLIFILDKTAGDKRIRLNSSKVNLIYPEFITEKEIQKHLKLEKKQKVGFHQIKVKRHRLEFSIHSYQVHEKNKFGILTVSITLKNQNNEIQYHKENTLRTSRPQVKLSIPLPANLKGNFTLLIEVLDRMANCQEKTTRTLEL